MTVASKCSTCGGAVAQGQHLDRDYCGAEPYPVIRYTRKKGESMMDMIDRMADDMIARDPGILTRLEEAMKKGKPKP